MTWYDFVFDNGYQVDASEAEQKLREKYPLLLHADERIELAFKDRGGKGRDKEYFTSHRILIKDGKGIGSKRKNYESIFYSKVQAWSVETAGAMDGDVDLQVWSTGVRWKKISFATSNVDIFQLQQMMNSKVGKYFKEAKGSQDKIDPKPANLGKKQTAAGNLVDFLGDNAKEVDSKKVEDRFKNETPILLEDETVQAAYKSGRDTTCFTDKRLLLVNVQGLLGKKIEFTTVLWSAVHAFSVRTAGAFLDRDMEMAIHTNICGSKLAEINQDFRHGKTDLFAVQKVLCNHILGEDRSPLPGVDLAKQGHIDVKGNWWFRDNQRPLDALEMDRVYHSEPPILQGSEHVEMAFKGRRDITLFTTKRLLIIDPQGLLGKAVQFTSVPWARIVAFGIRTAGKYLDFDTECVFYTEMRFIPGDDDTPPNPYMSCFSLDFNKNLVDLAKMKYYLSTRLLDIHKYEDGASIPMDDALTKHFDRPDGAERLFQWLGSDNREIDPSEMDQHLHTTMPILLDDEKTLMAFKAGRDVCIFTNLRFMEIDVKGLSGKKIEYNSIPYKSIRAFAVESAGVWDRDNEVKIYTRNRWSMAKTNIDFRAGKADIMQIQKFLSALTIGLPNDRKVDFGPKNYGVEAKAQLLGGNSFKAALCQNAKEIEAPVVDELYRTSPPLLLEEEHVLRAFQQGRDVYAFTNRRMIIADSKGLSGKRVKYKSIPYKYVHGFEIETPGNFDGDAELYLHTDISHSETEKLSIQKKTTDIYTMHEFCTKHILFGETFSKDTQEPEVFLDEPGSWTISIY